MTLHDWQQQNQFAFVQREHTGFIRVHAETTGHHDPQLWHLSDYVVTSVTGVWVGLSPRKETRRDAN